MSIAHLANKNNNIVSSSCFTCTQNHMVFGNDTGNSILSFNENGASIDFSNSNILNLSDISSSTIDDLQVNNNFNGTCNIKNQKIITDTSSLFFEMNENIQNNNIKGLGFYKKGPNPNIQTSVFTGDTASVSGFPYQSSIGVQNLLNLDHCFLLQTFDNSNFYSSLIVNDSGKYHALTLDNINGCKLESDRIEFQSNNIILPLLNSQSTSYNTALLTNNIGELSNLRLESNTFLPLGSNINRISNIASLGGNYSIIGNIVNCYFYLQCEVILGSGTPIISLQVPIPPNNPFSSDIIIGSANIYNVSLTSSFISPIIAQSSSNNLICMLIGTIVDTYYIKINCSYHLNN